jgi:FlaA1/EpsC-like NDP-sugar epimerase
VPKYVELFPKDYEIILAVRPGLTDPASFKYRSEGAMLREAADPEREYVNRILPDKIRMAKAYVADSCLSLDLALMLKTVLEAVGMEAAPIGRSIVRHRRPLVVGIHLVLIAVAYRLAWDLRFDGNIPPYETLLFWKFLPWLLAIRAVFFWRFRLYQGLWRYTSLWDASNVAVAVLLSAIPFVIVVRGVYGETAHPRTVFVIDAILLIALTVGVRLVRRTYHELSAGRPGIRVLVFGASDAGELVIRELKKSEKYRVIGLLDDDPDKRGRHIHGVPVLGGRGDLPAILAKHKPAEILVALNRENPLLLRELLRLVEPFSVDLTVLPAMTQSRGDRVELRDARGVRVEDLLSRSVVQVDHQAQESLIAERRVLVTGAGGVIGSELARQIVTFSPSALMLLDRHEHSLRTITSELATGRQRVNIVPLIADVTDAARIDAIMRQYRPGLVFHAATYKEAALVDANPGEAAANNVLGTRVLAEAAHRSEVERFVHVSSLDAVNPTTLVGTTARVVELMLREMSERSSTLFASVRFGDVLENDRGVIGRFMDQIRQGGPVTVSDPQTRRYVLLVPEAAELVLRVAACADASATYVLDIGEQMKLEDLARSLIRLSGRVPDEDIEIAYTAVGAESGLSDQLFGADEVATRTETRAILCLRNREPLVSEIVARVDEIQAAVSSGDDDGVRALLRGFRGRDSASGVEEPAEERPSPAVSLPRRVPEQTCPACKSDRVHRVRTTGLFDKVKKELTSRRLYACEACRWKGWLIPLDAGSVLLPHEDLPDLTSLDDLDVRPSEPRSNYPRKLA